MARKQNKIAAFIARIFTRKRYKLRNDKEYHKHLKSLSKNALIREVMRLRLALSVKERRMKKKAARDMNKSQAQRRKMLRKEIAKDKRAVKPAQPVIERTGKQIDPNSKAVNI